MATNFDLSPDSDPGKDASIIKDAIVAAVGRRGQQRIDLDRHTQFLMAVTEAIEAAFEKQNAAEAAMGFGPATGKEITEVMAAASAAVCTYANASKEEFEIAMGWIERDGFWEVET